MKSTLQFLLLFFSYVFFVSCSDSETNPQPIISNAHELPLLKTGKHIGTIIGFNASNPAQTQDSIQKRWDEALNSGMSIGRAQTDWIELEPQPNVFNKEALREKLEELSNKNLQVFLTLTAIDSEEAIPPSDLVGKPFDDPELIDRFKKLKDWVIPMLIEHNGFLIAISNEADNAFEEFPELIPQTVTFVKESREYIHSIDSRMAVTATMAEGSLDDGRSGLAEVLKECDVASLNFYGQDNGGTVQDVAKVNQEIDEMLAFAGNKLLIIQELGFSSGYEDGSSVMQSSPEKQGIFFDAFFQRMQSEPQLRAAVVFQLVDWSPDTTDLFMEAFENAGLSEEFLFAFRESLRTAGLIHYEDGSQKPAWNEFLKWIENFN